MNMGIKGQEINVFIKKGANWLLFAYLLFRCSFISNRLVNQDWI